MIWPCSCENCGDRAEHWHHVVPKSICEAGRHEVRNLLALCFGCHSGFHDGSVVLHREVLPRVVLAWVSEHASEGWLNHWYPARPEDAGVF